MNECMLRYMGFTVFFFLLSIESFIKNCSILLVLATIFKFTDNH